MFSKEKSLNWTAEHGPTIRKDLIFFFLCLIFTFLKLFLIRDEEIVCRFAELDQSWFINAANNLANFDWLGPYNHLTLVRPPGYPLWIWLVQLTGVPLRFAAESLMFFSALFLVLSFKRAGMPRWLCLIVYIVLIFHPFSIYINNEAQSESLYTPLLWLALGCLIFLHLSKNNHQRVKIALFAGLIFAGLWHTRLETLLLVSYLLCFALLELYYIFRESEPRRRKILKMTIIILIPFGMIGFASLTIRTVNFLKYGIFATSEMTAPGFEAAIQALIRLEHEIPRKYVTIPADARDRAYQKSPSFKELQSGLEGGIGRNWIEKWGCEYAGVCDDLSGNAFLWAFRESAAAMGHHRSAVEADTFYQRLADEINRACSTKGLSCRKISNGFAGLLHPYASAYLPYLKDSFLRVVKIFFGSGPKNKTMDVFASVNICEVFDRIANRKGGILNYSLLKDQKPFLFSIKGWVFNPEDPIAKVLIRRPLDLSEVYTEEFHYRPDVSRELAFKGLKATVNTGFSLDFYLKPEELRTTSLVFVSKKGKEWTVPTVQREIQNKDLFYNIESIYATVSTQGIQGLIEKIYFYILIFLSIVGIGALILLFVFFRSLKNSDNIFFILFFLSIVIGGRAVLCILLDASAFPFNYDEAIRYPYPVLGLFGSFVVILIYQAQRVLLARFDLSKKRKSEWHDTK